MAQPVSLMPAGFPYPTPLLLPLVDTARPSEAAPAPELLTTCLVELRLTSFQFTKKTSTPRRKARQ